MMRHKGLFLLTTIIVLAGEKSDIDANFIVAGALAVIILFFWGVYKAVKTQKIVYAFALLPFILLMAWMFFM
ncbi:MAG: hypothetical protein P794_09730 [Epsilonproteobacteria bacterium (ex Lamellibrachia satsuma)]|nr:MAG: hypothetical protein P794_09730 [Epsilonproteobacteria bacterium (ex Lamellibrachia satsuma)]